MLNSIVSIAIYENLLNVPGKSKTVPVILVCLYSELVFVRKLVGE
jgi:hypothetical protein